MASLELARDLGLEGREAPDLDRVTAALDAATELASIMMK